MFVLSSFLTGEASGLAGDPVGEAAGVAAGEVTGTGLDTGAGVAAGLLGVSGLFSQAANIAVAVARAAVNISFLIVFLLARFRKPLEIERTGRSRASIGSRMKIECLSANRPQIERFAIR